MNQERGLNHFHDSERGDIYDLYNACNGEMNGQLLDVRKLEELTAAEREVLDVERLREVWEHTASGCTTCAQIVCTLNLARGMMQRHADRRPAVNRVARPRARRAASRQR